MALRLFWTALLALVVGAGSLFGQRIGEKLPEMGLYTELPGQTGIRLNLRVVEGNFRAYFLDPEGKLVAPPLTDGRIVAEPPRKANERETFALALSSDGAYLLANRFVKPPYRYWVRVTLFSKANPDAATVLPRLDLNQQ